MTASPRSYHCLGVMLLSFLRMINNCTEIVTYISSTWYCRYIQPWKYFQPSCPRELWSCFHTWRTQSCHWQIIIMRSILLRHSPILPTVGGRGWPARWGCECRWDPPVQSARRSQLPRRTLFPAHPPWWRGGTRPKGRGLSSSASASSSLSWGPSRTHESAWKLPGREYRVLPILKFHKEHSHICLKTSVFIQFFFIDVQSRLDGIIHLWSNVRKKHFIQCVLTCVSLIS